MARFELQKNGSLRVYKDTRMGCLETEYFHSSFTFEEVEELCEYLKANYKGIRKTVLESKRKNLLDRIKDLRSANNIAHDVVKMRNNQINELELELGLVDAQLCNLGKKNGKKVKRV